MVPDYLKHNIDILRRRIEKAAIKSNRNPQDITLIAVTKNVDIETIKHLPRLGIVDLGENRVQELLKKSDAFTSQVVWHMIGHLQTNKARPRLLVGIDYLHSLDSLHLAEVLEKEACLLNKKIKVFIQVNVSGEQTKAGIKPDELKEFYQAVKVYPHLNIIGLMTMAPVVGDPELNRPVFRQLKELLDALRMGLSEKERLNFRHLSMGMSQDFEVAIEEGATFIRVGTVLFNKG